MLQRLVPVMIAAGVVLATSAGAAGPARAQRYDDYGQDWHEGWERDHCDCRHGYGQPYLRPGYYAPPPVYYAPPLRPYYAPPPVFTQPGYGPFVPFR